MSSSQQPQIKKVVASRKNLPADIIKKVEDENDKKLKQQLDRVKQKEDYFNKVLNKEPRSRSKAPEETVNLRIPRITDVSDKLNLTSESPVKKNNILDKNFKNFNAPKREV